VIGCLGKPKQREREKDRMKRKRKAECERSREVRYRVRDLPKCMEIFGHSLVELMSFSRAGEEADLVRSIKKAQLREGSHLHLVETILDHVFPSELPPGD
jgi:hypothetical protein